MFRDPSDVAGRWKAGSEWLELSTTNVIDNEFYGIHRTILGEHATSAEALNDVFAVRFRTNSSLSFSHVYVVTLWLLLCLLITSLLP